MDFTEPLLIILITVMSGTWASLILVMMRIELHVYARPWSLRKDASPQKAISTCPECGGNNGAHLANCSLSLSGCASKPEASKPRIQHHCKICNQVGHDTRNCPNQKEGKPNAT
jgi:hypothetical protein